MFCYPILEEIKILLLYIILNINIIYINTRGGRLFHPPYQVNFTVCEDSWPLTGRRRWYVMFIHAKYSTEVTIRAKHFLPSPFRTHINFVLCSMFIHKTHALEIVLNTVVINSRNRYKWKWIVVQHSQPTTNYDKVALTNRG